MIVYYKIYNKDLRRKNEILIEIKELLVPHPNIAELPSHQETVTPQRWRTAKGMSKVLGVNGSTYWTEEGGKKPEVKMLEGMFKAVNGKTAEELIQYASSI